MIIVSTIVGIILFAAGSVGLVITFINQVTGSLPWIEGLLTYGCFAVIGLGIIAIIVMTPRES